MAFPNAQIYAQIYPKSDMQTPERKGYRYSNLFFLDLLDATFDADDETGVGDVPLQQRHAEAVRLARSH